jgi:hypothetical protein
MSIAAILPPLTVKAMTENGFPSSMQTTPGAQMTSAGRLSGQGARSSALDEPPAPRRGPLSKHPPAHRRRREGSPPGRGRRRASGSHRLAQPRERRRQRFVELPRRRQGWRCAPERGGVHGGQVGEPRRGGAPRWARSPRKASRRCRAARTRCVRLARASRAPRACKADRVRQQCSGLVPSSRSMSGLGTCVSLRA